MSKTLLCVSGMLIGLIGCAHASPPETFSLNCDDKAPMPEQFVCLHNQARQSVSPAPAEKLPPVTWSDDLAESAQAWANQCQFEHDPKLKNQKIGENLAMFYGTPGSPRRTVQIWVNENRDYNYERNRCRSDKQCGHYTQVVWRNTTRIGCAVKHCSHQDNGTLWICRYEPPGNYIGEKPY